MTPDSDYQDVEIARIFDETDGVSYYLGDWHSHPGMGAVPSLTDRRTLRRIAAETEAAAPQPLMLILDNPEERWGVIGWQGRFGLLGRLGLSRLMRSDSSSDEGPPRTTTRAGALGAGRSEAR